MKDRTKKPDRSFLELVEEALFILLEFSFGSLLFLVFSNTFSSI